MKVPYSMDESEPDLYGGMGGLRSDEEERYVSEERTCQYRFYTQEDMDKVIQKNLKAIDKLRLEIDEAYDKGYWKGRDDGFSEGYEQGCEE